MEYNGIFVDAKMLANMSSELGSKVDELKAAKIGNISEDLCLERIPGQGKSKLCDVSQTSAYGSDISNLVSHAFRDMARTSDIAIQNAGGVREDVPAGDFTIGDAYKLLPFSNTLVELKMSGEEIKNVLEDALDYALNPEGSTGAYPYAAGDHQTKNAQALVNFGAAQMLHEKSLNSKISSLGFALKS